MREVICQILNLKICLTLRCGTSNEKRILLCEFVKRNNFSYGKNALEEWTLFFFLLAHPNLEIYFHKQLPEWCERPCGVHFKSIKSNLSFFTSPQMPLEQLVDAWLGTKNSPELNWLFQYLSLSLSHSNNQDQGHFNRCLWSIFQWMNDWVIYPSHIWGLVFHSFFHFQVRCSFHSSLSLFLFAKLTHCYNGSIVPLAMQGKGTHAIETVKHLSIHLLH